MIAKIVLWRNRRFGSLSSARVYERRSQLRSAEHVDNALALQISDVGLTVGKGSYGTLPGDIFWPSRSLQVHGSLFVYQPVKISSAADRRQCSSSAVSNTGLESRRLRPSGRLNRFHTLMRKSSAYNGVSASLWRRRRGNLIWGTAT
jgi:hypothetical protein